MRVVNGVEREVVRSEWENWLMDENARCEDVRGVLARDAARGGDGGAEGREKERESLEGVRGWVEGYCGSCGEDVAGLRAETRLEF